jgi:hypothetical protein
MLDYAGHQLARDFLCTQDCFCDHELLLVIHQVDLLATYSRSERHYRHIIIEPPQALES